MSLDADIAMKITEADKNLRRASLTELRERAMKLLPKMVKEDAAKSDEALVNMLGAISVTALALAEEIQKRQ